MGGHIRLLFSRGLSCRRMPDLRGLRDSHRSQRNLMLLLSPRLAESPSGILFTPAAAEEAAAEGAATPGGAMPRYTGTLGIHPHAPDAGGIIPSTYVRSSKYCRKAHSSAFVSRQRCISSRTSVLTCSNEVLGPPEWEWLSHAM